jgi:DNA polymerase-1
VLNFIYHGTSTDSEDKLLERLLHPVSGIIAVDTETISLTNTGCIGIGIAVSPSDTYYIPLYPERSPILNQVYSLLVRPDLTKVWHNGNFDIQVLSVLGKDEGYPPIDLWNMHDTSIMAQVQGLQPDLHGLGNNLLHDYDLFEISDLLDEARESTGRKHVTMLDVDLERVALKCCNDVRTTFNLLPILMARLSQRTQDCYEVDRRLTGWLKVIEGRGLKLNQEKLDEYYQSLAMQMMVIEDAADELGFSISSNQQLGMYLANNKIVLPLTKSGRQLDTSEEVLRTINHPVAEMALEYRHLQKSNGTYIEPSRHADRQYSHFRLDLATGRLASKGLGCDFHRCTNQQNVPPELRDMYTPDNGIFTWADMSQLEMRVFAKYTQDPTLLDIYRNDKSVHEITFRSIYPHLTYDKNIPEYTKAKTFNFAMIFDAQDGTLASQCGIDRATASEWKRIWFNTYPGAQEWMHVQQSTNSVYEETLFGRRMLIPKDRGYHHANTCRINYPIQGSGADLNKRALLYIMEHVKGEDIRLQVHDEIVNDGDIDLPMREISNLYPNLEIPWEVKKGKVWG